MHLDAGAIQRYGFEFHPNDLIRLKLLEDPIQHTGLGPPVHARIDGVPVSEPLGQSAPLTAVLCDVKDRVEYIQIRKADVATLPRQAVFDQRELITSYFHVRILANGKRLC